MEALTVEQMRVIDANSDWFGVSFLQLMENAGRAAAAEANKLGSSFAVICGPGNNGGDGFVAARYLKSKPKVFYFYPPKTTESYENFVSAKNYHPVQITPKSMPELAKALSTCDVIIDAIFGIGAKGRMREPFRSVVEIMNKSGKKIVSVDVPSGMDPATGKTEDIAVKADITVCLHAAKTGLVNNKGVGKLVIADIGIHPKAVTHVGKGDFKFGYPRRKPDARKGDAGKVLVVGGSVNYTGAPYFAAMAALKAGCDLSYVAAPIKAARKISILGPDLIIYPLKSDEMISAGDVKAVLSRDFDVLCIGNGMGADKASLAAAKSIISKTTKPMVIDGDGLKAAKPLLKSLSSNVIITPHRGEFKMLFGLEANEANLRKVASGLKCVVLLKGPVDIITQGKDLKYNESGNPYMSKGGTGDVLAGLCAGFLAQGVETFKAAGFAALVNGVAGNLAYVDESIALTASDVLAKVGKAEKMLLG